MWKDLNFPPELEAESGDELDENYAIKKEWRVIVTDTNAQKHWDTNN